MTVTERGSRPSLSGYPVNMLVRDRRVVVVGAGRIAARKIEPLLDAGALVEVIAPKANDEVQGWADSGRLVFHRRPFAPADVEGAWLALTATDDPEVNAAVHEAAEAARVWVNSADDPANCSWERRSVLSTRPWSTFFPRPGKPCGEPGVHPRTPTGNPCSRAASWNSCVRVGSTRQGSC